MARYHQKHHQHSEQATSARSTASHKRYRLADLIQQCDFNLPESPEIVLWRDAPAVGAEVVK
jgi:antitoxin component of MazEF toxin-antitoxin module